MGTVTPMAIFEASERPVWAFPTAAPPPVRSGSGGGVVSPFPVDVEDDPDALLVGGFEVITRPWIVGSVAAASTLQKPEDEVGQATCG